MALQAEPRYQAVALKEAVHMPSVTAGGKLLQLSLCQRLAPWLTGTSPKLSRTGAAMGHRQRPSLSTACRAVCPPRKKRREKGRKKRKRKKEKKRKIVRRGGKVRGAFAGGAKQSSNKEVGGETERTSQGSQQNRTKPGCLLHGQAPKALLSQRPNGLCVLC